MACEAGGRTGCSPFAGRGGSRGDFRRGRTKRWTASCAGQRAMRAACGCPSWARPCRGPGSGWRKPLAGPGPLNRHLASAGAAPPLRASGPMGRLPSARRLASQGGKASPSGQKGVGSRMKRSGRIARLAGGGPGSRASCAVPNRSRRDWAQISAWRAAPLGLLEFSRLINGLFSRWSGNWAIALKQPRLGRRQGDGGGAGQRRGSAVSGANGDRRRRGAVSPAEANARRDAPSAVVRTLGGGQNALDWAARPVQAAGAEATAGFRRSRLPWPDWPSCCVRFWGQRGPQPEGLSARSCQG